jgi:hypothetical protein
MVIYLGNEVLHVNQFFAGLGILHQKGLIDVKLKKALDKGPGKPYVECVIEGKKLVFEFHDRLGYMEKNKYDWCDFYVKRTLTKDLIREYPKLIPWGLNFYTTSKYDFALKRALLKTSLKTAVSSYLMNSSVLSKILNNVKLSRILQVKHAAYTASYESFYQEPLESKLPIIIFLPQLWDPVRVFDHSRKEDRLRLNNERIDFVRALKKNFPKLYIGGIEDSPFARKICPDLVLDVKITHKTNYIKELRKASIGISTPGLVDSIGWKFGEYMLFSKAIVSNEIGHQVLNAPLNAEVNYCAYTSIESMLSCVERFIKEEDFRYSVMNNNYQYSEKFLKPDRQLQIVLKKIGFDISV